MSEEITSQKTGIIRDEQGRFVDGVSGNPSGRPSETLEIKLIKKVSKEFIEDYREDLAATLPKLSAVLIKKAMKGDINSIREIHNIVIGKPKQSTEISFDQSLPKIIAIDE